MVNGSREAGSFKKIKRYFDVSLTAPNTDISYIINEVPYAVEESDLISFFNLTFDYFKDTDGPFWDINDNYLDFWEKLFLLNDDKVTNQLVQFIKSNDDLVMLYLRAFPQRVNYFADDTSFIRNLWHSKIFESGTDAKGDLKLYCALLRNKLIESEQLSEANQKIIYKFKSVTPDELQKADSRAPAEEEPGPGFRSRDQAARGNRPPVLCSRRSARRPRSGRRRAGRRPRPRASGTPGIPSRRSAR